MAWGYKEGMEWTISSVKIAIKVVWFGGDFFKEVQILWGLSR